MENKKSKGEFISDNLIRLSGGVIVGGILTQMHAMVFIGLAIFLAGEAYRFYHFRTYKSDNMRVIAALVICLAIGLINKYFQFF